MKLLITTLTMIFMSFGANALTVERLYKNCRPFQNNGFEFKNLSDTQRKNAIACMSYLAGVRDAGVSHCDMLGEYKKMNFLDKEKLTIVSELSANANPNIDQVITSFTNYAENNTNHWNNSATSYANLYLYTKFPCKLDDKTPKEKE